MHVRRLGTALCLLGLGLHEIISLSTEKKNVQEGQRSSPSLCKAAGMR